MTATHQATRFFHGWHDWPSPARVAVSDGLTIDDLTNHEGLAWTWGADAGTFGTNLAFSLLADAESISVAYQYSARFRDEVVSHLSAREWRLTSHQIAAWVRAAEATP